VPRGFCVYGHNRKYTRHFDNVGDLGEYVTCHVLVSYSRPFFFYFIFGSRPAPTGGPILKIYKPHDVHPSAQGRIFWGSRWHCSPFLWGQIPQNPYFGPKSIFWAKIHILGDVNRRFKPNSQTINLKNSLIIKTTISIPTKLCTTIKTIK